MKPNTTPPALEFQKLLQINQLCDEFEAALREGKAPRLEAYLKRAGGHASAALEHLLPIDIEYRRRRGEQPTADEYARRFPKCDREKLDRFFQRPEDEPFPPTLGEYDLVRRIGTGGMAVVYLARHRRMNRNVALKAIAPGLNDRDALLQRFAREVELTARFSHPNVVAALDAREDQGIVYLVTNYLDGGDLGRLIRRSGPLPVPTALRYIRAAALGLAHAHARGVIHRDVKPSNLLLDGNDQVCVADWGLARTGASASNLVPLTASGIIIGTVDYLAPEQAGGSHKADARSDVYSLGCVLFFLLTGRPPFDQGTIWDRLAAHRETPAPGVRFLRPELPISLGKLVGRMLAKDPTDRPESMDAVVAALDALSEEQRTEVLPAPEPPEPHEPAKEGLSRRRLLWVGAAVGVLPAVGFALAHALSPKKVVVEPEKPPPEIPKPRPPAPPIAEMPYANPKEYQQRWADHLQLPVERTDAIGAVNFRFVLIPPGTFRMGSPADLIARLTARPNLDDWHRAWYVAEKERVVTIRRAFYLGKTEVTHEQFKLFVSRERHVTFAEQHGNGWAYHGPEEKWKLEPGASWKSAGEYVPAANHPVINVGAIDAIKFCRWLRAETNSECRLPAESEWEFACRGGRYGLWSHGDDEGKLADFAVYGVDLPNPVGTRKPNGFGLLDMTGNAAERCAIEDPWTDDPARSPNLGGAIYPVRGGRFNEVREPVGVWPDAYRAARRTWEDGSDLTAGFRVLREIPA